MEPKHVSETMNSFLFEMFAKWERENAPVWQDEAVRKSIQEWRSKHPELGG